MSAAHRILLAVLALVVISALTAVSTLSDEGVVEGAPSVVAHTPSEDVEAQRSEQWLRAQVREARLVQPLGTD